VVVTCANGCSGEDTAIVTQDITNPTVTVDDVSVCSGGTATLTADTTGSPCTVTGYQWYEGTSSSGTPITGATNQTYQTTVAGDYTCKVTCDNGCTAEDYGTVTVYPGPTADAGPDRTINFGGSVGIGGSPTAIGGTPPYTYSWTPTTGLNNPTIANPIASPTSTTIYTVLVTDNNGCTDTDSMTVTVQTLPPPCPDVYGLGGPGCSFNIDMLGKITRVDVECCSNTVLGTRTASDPDDMHFLRIEQDTLVICEDCAGCGCYPRVVVMSLATETPPLPQGKIAIGPIYDFKGYMDIDRLIVCTPVTFNSPISMVLSYDPDELPEGALAPVLAYYDDDLGHWVELSPDPGRVAEVGKIAVLADYFKSPFAILVEVSSQPAAPAAFSLSNLQIVPIAQKSGEEITITADITNSGGQEGSYTAILEINGEVRGTRELVLEPGQSEQVVFTVSDNEPGQHTVVLGSLSGEFTILSPTNWWLIGSITAAFILLVLVLGWLFWYRKRI
jgi:hypothetical protein